MNFETERDEQRRRQGSKSGTNNRHAAKGGEGEKRGGDSAVGTALRNAYQRTIAEDIPPEMLDLLGKLG